MNRLKSLWMNHFGLMYFKTQKYFPIAKLLGLFQFYLGKNFVFTL